MTTFIAGFDAPQGVDDDYAQRLSGWFVPAVTGDYVFFVSSDDNGELWLSTDENPANKKLIARETAWSNTKQWTASGGSSDLSSKRSDEFPETQWPTGNKIKGEDGGRSRLVPQRQTSSGRRLRRKPARAGRTLKTE